MSFMSQDGRHSGHVTPCLFEVLITSLKVKSPIYYPVKVKFSILILKKSMDFYLNS